MKNWLAKTALSCGRASVKPSKVPSGLNQSSIPSHLSYCHCLSLALTDLILDYQHPHKKRIPSKDNLLNFPYLHLQGFLLFFLPWVPNPSLLLLFLTFILQPTLHPTNCLQQKQQCQSFSPSCVATSPCKHPLSFPLLINAAVT